VNNQWDKTTWLGHEKFREALALAIDRKEIVDYIFGGQAQESGSGVTCYGSYALGYQPVPLIPYDPDRAAKLVQEVIRESFPGQKPELNLYSTIALTVPEYQRVAEAAAAYWSKIGVTTKVIPTEYQTYRTAASRKPEPDLRNSMMVFALGNRLLWDGCMNIYWRSTGMLGFSRDPQFDALLDAFGSEINPAMVSKRQYEAALYVRQHYMAIGLLETALISVANPEKVTKWPNVSNKVAYTVWLEDQYTR
ncbi:MAG: hypothetical protein HY680_11700, partial [Chloroflexi bacterium]|nr:hypothetical protein [Chloroflexota bacterium]